MAYHSSVRDFAVLISVVRGSMLALVRLFDQSLKRTGYEHDYRPIAKIYHCASIYNMHVKMCCVT